MKGVGPSRAKTIASELKIETYEDLLHFFPHRYIDKSQYFKINQIQANSAEIQLVGKITSVKTVAMKRGSRLVATFVDATGSLELVWFRNAKWIKDALVLHTDYVIFGKINHFKGHFSMPHPEMELMSKHKQSVKGTMEPVYHSTEKLGKAGISNRVMGKMVQSLLGEVYGKCAETLSENIINEQGLISRNDALLNIHFPRSYDLLTKAQQRLKFEELFFIQLRLIRKNMMHKVKYKGFPFEGIGAFFNDFYSNYLPFSLTDAQKRVVREIRKDLGSNAHMNRLLQGDVGSGKTIVALLTMLIALDNGFQACLMAPTEILAIQHFQSISELVKEMPIQISLLTGSSKAKQRREIHSSLEDGSLHILVGTHALIEDKVKFKNLGLAIIDEQHRFGVAQRSKMWMKNTLPPHILVMTATPIPRTLAMSLYGDLDISVIDELPPGRKEIVTAHRYDKNRLSVFHFMRKEIEKGRQIYVVYPLIEESEAMDYKDLMDGYESVVREFPVPKYQISIVHGKMKADVKEYEMNRFVQGETQIMVATTVIEVGVNVPNASVMVIESAEKFGLSQLHQLRGRVGRGADQSFCILMSSFKLSANAKTRLETMVETSDGFKISEVDLKLRGPGNLMGTQQSGVLQLKIADIIKDSHILAKAREIAIQVLREDPNLALSSHKGIKNRYEQLQEKRSNWSKIS